MDWRAVVVDPATTLAETIERIDRSGLQVGLVVDEGRILRSLQRRPSRTSYVFATAFAGVWVLAGLVLGWMYLPQLQATFGPTGLTAPVLAVLAAAFFVPIIFFYVLAHMAWRAQELRVTNSILGCKKSLIFWRAMTIRFWSSRRLFHQKSEAPLVEVAHCKFPPGSFD